MYVARPKFDPCSVMLSDPVDGRFVPSVTLSADFISTERAAVTLPTRTPTLADTTRLALTPCAVLHCSEVSATQLVASHADPPTRTDSVYVARPKFDPCSVMLSDPVDGRFAPSVTLSADFMSIDSNDVTLPIEHPTVMLVILLAPTPCPARHMTHVSDTQSDASHAV